MTAQTRREMLIRALVAAALCSAALLVCSNYVSIDEPYARGRHLVVFDEEAASPAATSSTNAEAADEEESSLRGELNSLGRKLATNDEPGSLRILSLGGEITQGERLLDPMTERYTALIHEANHRVVVRNLSHRALSALYSFSCIQTMVEGNLRVEGEPPDEEYDVILMEFSHTGYSGLYSLCHRLVERYPNAIIIYIHLHSRLARPLRKPLRATGQDAKEHEHQLRDIMDRFGGAMYVLPQDDTSSKYFAPNGHYLNAMGHLKLATEVTRIIGDVQAARIDLPLFPVAKAGSWHGGDQCYNWYNGFGGFAPGIEFQGDGSNKIFQGTLKEKTAKWAFEVPSGGTTGSIHFEYEPMPRPNGEPEPVFVHYIADKDESTYPRTNLSVDGGPETGVVINPVQTPLWPVLHHIKTVKVGTLNEGLHHFVNVQPLETNKDQPIRIVGITICPVCNLMVNFKHDFETLMGPFKSADDGRLPNPAF